MTGMMITPTPDINQLVYCREVAKVSGDIQLTGDTGEVSGDQREFEAEV